MKNKWESRERKNKRTALIVALLLHAIVIFFVSSGTGSNSIQQLIEHVFSVDQPESSVQS